MAFVPGFSNDVFISYAHIDNEGSRWVSCFVQDLTMALRQRLGARNEFKLFFDSENLEIAHALDRLREEVRNSAVLVAIFSPSYAVAEEWTMEEFNTFQASAGNSERTVIIEKLPIEDDQYPEVAKNLLRAPFHKPDKDNKVPRTLGRQQQRSAYIKGIDALAQHIRNRLVELREAIEGQEETVRGSEPTGPTGNGGGAQPISVTVQPPDPNAPVVLLGRVTDDLGDDRDQIRSSLEQFGVRILPPDDYPDATFCERFAADVAELERAKIKVFVQLVGRYPRRPPLLPDGYERHQINAARAAGIPVLHWRKKDFDADAVTDPVHQALALEAAAGTVEELKGKIRAVCFPPQPKVVDIPPGRVFLNSDESDRDLAIRLMDALFENDFSAVIPRFDEDMRQDIDENIKACSALVFVYGGVGWKWLRQQMLHAESLLPGRPTPPRLLRVFKAPPPEKEDPGVRLRGCREVTSIEQLIQELRA